MIVGNLLFLEGKSNQNNRRGAKLKEVDTPTVRHRHIQGIFSFRYRNSDFHLQRLGFSER
ncbi:unknown [Bacteroides sp. CAG:462]|nr:unknown [Bacteroides sp. CAG:462]